MEYLLFIVGILFLFGVVGVIQYLCWLAAYGIEEYRAGGISIRKKWDVDLSRYDKEVRYVLTACKGYRFFHRALEDSRPILDKTCIVLIENLYAGETKCIGLAKRVYFMGLPGIKRYLIYIDLGSVRSKNLDYNAIEGLIRHEYTHHHVEYTTGEPDPNHSNYIWKQIQS